MNTTTTTTTRRVIPKQRQNQQRKVKVVKRIRQINIRRSNQRRRRRRRRRIINTSMPVAYTPGFQPNFRVMYQSANAMLVAGRDLIYQIPDTLVTAQDTSVITAIPSNPAYWIGTRISTIAAGYQNYRPLLFRVHYVPQCASTQQGNVIGGTLWDQVPTREGLQQSLKTSSGNILTQAFKPAVALVKLQGNLQTNLFRVAGKFDQLSNPFMYLGISVGTYNSQNQRIIPGYFYVEYKYTFKNPIGSGVQFYNSGIIPYSASRLQYSNSTLFVCSNTSQVRAFRNGITSTIDLNIGTTLQQDLMDNQVVLTYNDSQVELPNTSYVWQFANTTMTANNQVLNPTTVTTQLNQTPRAYNDTDVYVSYDSGFFFYYYLDQPSNLVTGYLIIPTVTTATTLTQSVLVTLKGETTETWYHAEARSSALTYIGTYYLKTSGSFIITQLNPTFINWVLLPPSSKQTNTSKGLTQKRTPNIGRGISLASGSANVICDVPYMEQANAHQQPTCKSQSMHPSLTESEGSESSDEDIKSC
jgi:hypothetical protein